MSAGIGPLTWAEHGITIGDIASALFYEANRRGGKIRYKVVLANVQRDQMFWKANDNTRYDSQNLGSAFVGIAIASGWGDEHARVLLSRNFLQQASVDEHVSKYRFAFHGTNYDSLKKILVEGFRRNQKGRLNIHGASIAPWLFGKLGYMQNPFFKPTKPQERCYVIVINVQNTQSWNDSKVYINARRSYEFGCDEGVGVIDQVWYINFHGSHDSVNWHMALIYDKRFKTFPVVGMLDAYGARQSSDGKWIYAKQCGPVRGFSPVKPEGATRGALEKSYPAGFVRWGYCPSCSNIYAPGQVRCIATLEQANYGCWQNPFLFQAAPNLVLSSPLERISPTASTHLYINWWWSN